MASVTIYGISNEITSANDNDLLPIWDSENDRTAKIKTSKLLQGYQTELTFDSTPTSGSSNPVTSDGIATAIANAGSPLIVASSATVTGSTLAANSVLKFYFTADVTGSDTETALAITYNETDIAVKAVKGGALVDIYAHEIDSAYYYLQAYTTLEVIYDGTQFVIVGNPVVLSSDNYTIYADGFIKQWVNLNTSSGTYTYTFQIAFKNIPYAYRSLFANFTSSTYLNDTILRGLTTTEVTYLVSGAYTVQNNQLYVFGY